MNKNITSGVRIVMVETTHPGNIGAAARAMKTMGQHRLYLVRPKIYPSAEVTARAAGADDVLADAVVCDSLQDAIRDCVLVIATSARERSISWPVLDPRTAARQITETAVNDNVALVFGRESSGLSNQEIEMCNAMVRIPASNEFSSLNVAAAIQLLCYEILLADQFKKDIVKDSNHVVPLVNADEMEKFYEHLEQCMTETRFLDPDKPRRLMHRLKRLFNRTQLDQNELNILRGFLTSVQDIIRNRVKDPKK